MVRDGDMTEAVERTRPNDQTTGRPYRDFAIKVAIAAGILSVSTVATVLVCIALVTDYVSEYAGLGSGRAFWAQVEQKLYKYADQPDIPEEKKARIIAALKKVGDKNRPFIDALLGSK